MSYGNNQLRAVFEPTVQGTYLSNKELIRVMNGAYGQNIFVAQFRLPTLGKPRNLPVLEQRVIQITANNGIAIMHNTGSGLWFRYASPELLAQYNVSLNTTDIFQVATWTPNQGNTVSSFTADNFYHCGLIVNGVFVPTPEFTGNVPPGVATDYYTGDAISGAGYKPYADIYLVGLYGFRVSNMSVALNVCRTLYNQGSGVDPLAHPYLRKFTPTVLHLDAASTRVPRSTWHDNDHIERGYFLPGLTKRTHDTKLAGKSFPVRGQQAAYMPPVHILQSQQISDYIYEGAYPVVGLQLMFLFGSPDERYYDATMGLLGPIRQHDGNTDLPGNWDGELILAGNRLCGQAAGEVVSSVVTRSLITHLHLQWGDRNWQAYQYGAGTHDLTWTQLVDMHAINADNVRLSGFHFHRDASVTRPLNVYNVRLNSNPFQQDVATIFNYTQVKNTNFAIQDCGEGLIGSPVFSDTTVNYTGWRNGMSGCIPQPPNSLRNLDLSFNYLTCLPPHFAFTSQVALHYNNLRGTLIADYATQIITGHPAFSGFGQRASGQADDFLVFDLRAQKVNIDYLWISSSKIKLMYWPEEGRSIASCLMQENPDLVFGNDFPANLRITSSFRASNIGQSRFHFPFGSVIVASTISVDNNQMDEETVNWNVDRWLDTQASWADRLSLTKVFNIGGNNHWVTEQGRPSRLAEIQQTAEDKNWLVELNIALQTYRHYSRINRWIPVPGYPDMVAVEMNHYTNNDPIEVINTVNFNGPVVSAPGGQPVNPRDNSQYNDGTNWSIVGAGFDYNEAYNRMTGSPSYFGSWEVTDRTPWMYNTGSNGPWKILWRKNSNFSSTPSESGVMVLSGTNVYHD